MKRLFFSVALTTFSLSLLAQSLPPSGYYRVQNVKSKRYITLIDDYGTLIMSSADADLGALRTFKFSEETVLTNPASVIYAEHRVDNKYDLQSQGTGVYEIVQHVLQLQANADGTYSTFASMSGVTKYLWENNSEFGDFGGVGINNFSATNQSFRWNVLPVSSTDDNNYFGIKPTIQIGSDWYKDFYADFNFSFASSGMEAFYVTTVDASKGLAVYKKIEGNVPRSTPIYVKCSSNQSTNNRLNILTTEAPAISGNQMAGVFFCNTPNTHYSNANHIDCLEYDPATMRILGKTSDGSLGFVKATDADLVVEQNGSPRATHKYLPHNTAYLVVPSTAPAELKLVTQKEYEEAQVVDITVTANNVTRVYGDANPAFTYTASGTLNGTPQLTCAATATSPVGTYPILVAQGSVTGANVVGVAGTLTITPAPLTVKADDKTRLENTDNPAFTISYTGWKNGESEAVLDTKPVATTTATKTSAPGTYPITVTGGSAKNYTLSYVNGTLTITSGTLALTAKSYTREYGEENPAFEFEQSGTAILRGTPSITCAATKTSAVGTYDIVIAKGSVENENVTFVNGKLTITPAKLIVTANAASREYGDENPALTVSYSGFKNGETDAVLTTKPTATTTATKVSDAAVYVISVSGGAATNYTFQYEPGMLTVNKAVLTVKANDVKREEGEPNPEFTITYSGFKNNQTEAVLTTKPVASTMANTSSLPGEYPITVSGGEAENYTFNYVAGTLTITEKSGIEDIIGDAAAFNVYTVSGMKVRTAVTTLEGLPAGIYVVNGKKVLVK